MKNILAKVMFVFLAIILISGCTVRSKDQGKIIIKVACWGTPEELDIIKTTISSWKKNNPKIEVKLEPIVYQSYVHKILTRIAGGAAPDVIFSEVDMFADLYNKDAFLDLTSFIKEDPHFDINDYFPEVVDRFTINGKIYCIPRDTAPFACIYYNKNLFDQYGVPYPQDDWDWNDLLEKAKKLTIVENERTVCYGFFAWAWQNFVYSNGGRIVDDVKNPKFFTLDQAEAVEGLQFHADLVLKYKVSPSQTALNNLGAGVIQLFIQEKLAMFSSGIWETPLFRKIKNFEWDIAMFPKGLNGKRGFGTGGSGYCILKTTKHPKESWEVVKALSGEYGQRRFAEAGLAQPANKRIASGECWAGSKEPPLNKKMLNEAVQYVTYNPFHSQWRKILALVITPQLDLMYNGEITAKEAMEKAVLEANKMLEKKK
jgi:ABC-type glycerol-3-phosphate transport system substrate-binding protein